MRIRVTKKDIKCGKRFKAESCPVALALRRKLGSECAVTGFHIWIGHERFNLTGPVEEFVLRFDSGKPVQPFTFELDYKP